MRHGSGLVMLLVLGGGFFVLLVLFGTPRRGQRSPGTYAPGQGVTSYAVKGLTLPPPNTPCKLGEWRWANHAETKTAFIRGTIDTDGVHRVRVEARDRLGNWVGRKEASVDSDGRFEIEFGRPNYTGDMKIHVTCDPNSAYDPVVDYGN